MKFSIVVFYLTATIGLSTLDIRASSPEWTIPFPEGKTILEAIQKPGESRESELRIVLTSLLVDDGNTFTRTQALSYLTRLSRWYDFQHQEDVFRRVAEIYGDSSFLSLLEMQQFLRSPKEHRIAVLKTALESGQADLPLGGEILRVTAMEIVARSGLEDLAPLVEAVHEKLGDVDRESFPLVRFRLEMELTRASSDREDTLIRAAERLPEVYSMTRDDDLDGSELGRLAYLYAKEACERNPIDRTVSSACPSFGTAVEQIESVLRKSEGTIPKWLGNVRKLVWTTENSKSLSEESRRRFESVMEGTRR